MFCLLVVLPLLQLQAQTYRPALPDPTASATAPPSSNVDERIKAAGVPNDDYVHIRSVTQEVEGTIRHLRGMVTIQTVDMKLTADEVDYNEETGDTEARGHVHYEQFAKGEILDCSRAEYNVDTEMGKFYDVSGTSTPRIQARPGLLTTTNPFYFESLWAEKIQDHFILHNGFLTDCKLPRAWWRLKSKTIFYVPNEHAITHSSWFYLRNVRLFYFPFFYKSLKKEPRTSGFLLPNFGNSSTRGQFFGLGYFWAINRSYDLTYDARYFSTAGLAHHLAVRGDPNARTKFDLMADGIKDERPDIPSGASVLAHVRSDLGNGWQANGVLDYISSFGFREQSTDSYNEAVSSQTHSVAYAAKHWSDFGLNVVAQQNVNYLGTGPKQDISIRKLPEADFTAREHQLDFLKWPVWFSMDSSAGLLTRSMQFETTPALVPRIDLAPHLTTAFHFAGIQLVPTFGIRETYYNTSYTPSGALVSGSLLRNSRDFTLDLVLPSLSRTFNAPAFLGQKLKHVIEPRITYKNVSGIDDFARVVRFDETDILSNTNQLEFSLANRLLSKDKNGVITDLVTWTLLYDRYFDPTFGGAVIPGQRNSISSELDLTGFAFIDGYRHSSPVVSSLHVKLPNHMDFDWRSDYDPVVSHLVNSSVSIYGRFNQFTVSASQYDLKTSAVLAGSSNQTGFRVSYGSANRRGFSAGLDTRYDFEVGALQYVQTQVTYNTDCCGLSVQYLRFPRTIGGTESTFRVAFAISNIGTFGNLTRQERLF